MRASSLVYIGVRLTFAALIVAFGTFMLRKWNPGHNEPANWVTRPRPRWWRPSSRSRRRPLEPPVAVGRGAESVGRSRRGSRSADRIRTPSVRPSTQGGRRPVRRVDRPDDRPARPATDPPADRGRAAGPTAGPGANPILWRELMTRAYGTKPLIIKGGYLLLFALGVGFFLNLGQGLEQPAGDDAWR